MGSEEIIKIFEQDFVDYLKGGIRGFMDDKRRAGYLGVYNSSESFNLLNEKFQGLGPFYFGMAIKKLSEVERIEFKHSVYFLNSTEE